MMGGSWEGLCIRYFRLEPAVSWRKSFEYVLKKKLLIYFNVLLYHHLLVFYNPMS